MDDAPAPQFDPRTAYHEAGHHRWQVAGANLCGRSRFERRAGHRRVHFPDEAIAAPRHGLDPARDFRIVGQGRAQFGHHRLDDALGNKASAPYGVEQIVLAQSAARADPLA